MLVVITTTTTTSDHNRDVMELAVFIFVIMWIMFYYYLSESQSVRVRVFYFLLLLFLWIRWWVVQTLLWYNIIPRILWNILWHQSYCSTIFQNTHCAYDTKLYREFTPKNASRHVNSTYSSVRMTYTNTCRIKAKYTKMSSTRNWYK